MLALSSQLVLHQSRMRGYMHTENDTRSQKQGSQVPQDFLWNVK